MRPDDHEPNLLIHGFTWTQGKAMMLCLHCDNTAIANSYDTTRDPTPRWISAAKQHLKDKHNLDTLIPLGDPSMVGVMLQHGARRPASRYDVGVREVALKVPPDLYGKNSTVVMQAVCDLCGWMTTSENNDGFLLLDIHDHLHNRHADPSGEVYARGDTRQRLADYINSTGLLLRINNPDEPHTEGEASDVATAPNTPEALVLPSEMAEAMRSAASGMLGVADMIQARVEDLRAIFADMQKSLAAVADVLTARSAVNPQVKGLDEPPIEG
jgi:hypothetical protein